MKVHYFDTVISIPLWLGIVVIALFLILILLITAKVISQKWFVCDECGTRFKPKGFNVLFKTNYVDGRTLLKCPNCKKVRACTESYKQDK